MLKFREWFVINENKEEKALASELAGDASVITALSTVIPQKDKNADKLLLLAAYYYSKVKDIEQVKTDMTAYIGYLNRDKMKLINVELASKKPNPPWDDYLSWTEVIHTHQADDADKEKSKFKPSDIDFQNEKPILISQDGKIRVYEANNPQQCIILGKGQSFCISQPGNINWQGYRDRDTSTYYFVYDDTRPADDRLSIVVVDVRPNGIVLTDKPNKTGATLDPYTGQLTNDSSSYMRYLREKGIDTSKIVNIPKSAEEQKEHEELGKTKTDFDWFKSLSPDYKSKYIGRGHKLTDEQFDYLWQNKFTSLLTKYVKTGLLLNDYQIDKIASNRDLKDNYLHNRLIADQNSGNLTKKEYALFSVKQKESYYNNINENKKLDKAIKFGDLDFYKYLVNEKGLKIGDDAVITAAKSGNLEIVEYLVEKGAKIDKNALEKAVIIGNLAIVKYLVNKVEKIDDNLVSDAVKYNYIPIVKFLVDEKNVKISNNTIINAAQNGNLDLVKYLVNKVENVDDYIVNYVTNLGDLDFLKHLINEKNAIISSDILIRAILSDNLAVVKYLVDEKNLEVSNSHVNSAARNCNLDIVKYLAKKCKENIEINGFTLRRVTQEGNLDMVKYLVDEKGAKVNDITLQLAIVSGNLALVKYLVDEKNLEISNDIVELAAKSDNSYIIKYLVDEKGAKISSHAIDIAVEYKNSSVIDYFVEKGVLII
jgi:hypothetical protein